MSQAVGEVEEKVLKSQGFESVFCSFEGRGFMTGGAEEEEGAKAKATAKATAKAKAKAKPHLVGWVLGVTPAAHQSQDVAAEQHLHLPDSAVLELASELSCHTP